MPNGLLSSFVPVVLPDIPKTAYAPIDLSVNNKSLSTVDLAQPLEVQRYINERARTNNAKVLYGGYLEKRNLYKSSAYFTSSSEDERDIHLGVDFWCPENSPVVAPLAGKVHSFKINTNIGDYGPTIILEHQWLNKPLYTLYGHLTLASLNDLYKGKPIQQGEIIGALGNSSINGGYAPHLHFQVILAITNHSGDYPGVCSMLDLPFYQKNGMDPLPFLNF